MATTHKSPPAPFNHLHVHTQYSLLDGHSNIKRLVKTASELRMEALAITDHGNMFGAIEFYKTAKQYGINPVLGVEGYIVADINERGERFDYNHLLLFAMNNEGYQNLLKLVTLSHTRGFYYKPRMDKQLLLQYNAGLIVTSGCLAGEIPQLVLADKLEEAHRVAEWYLEVFGRERFYIELQDHKEGGEQEIVNAAMLQIAKRYKLKLLATNDLHYVDAGDATAQDVMLCVQTNAKVTDEKRMRFGSPNYWLKPAQDMIHLFGHLPGALHSSLDIGRMCHVEIPFGQDLLPRYKVPTGEPASEFLLRLVRAGVRDRYGRLGDDLEARMNYELSIIQEKGFVDYFLIVWDYVNYARSRGMRCVARGSVAGSIVAYALGISNVDPLRYGLAFERFLNPDRTAMPDIDMDFPDDRREEVIRYVAETYGWDKVAQMVTMNRMASKAAVRDVGRVFDDYATADRISRLIPNGASLAQQLQDNDDLKDLYTHNAAAHSILNYAQLLEGTVRNAGIHAAGIVISNTALDTVVPCQLRDTKAEQPWLVAQYEQAHLEELGLLKMDFLGLSNLTILQTTQQLIQENYGIEIDLDHIDAEDPAVFELLSRGETTGVFQLESGAMRRYIRELKPTRVDDIMAMVALYRPGPMESIPRYIGAKHGRITPSYPHRDLEDILRETYGVIVYQDQVLLTVMKLAGFSWGEVDKFRKAIGKKIASEMAAQKDKFIKGCVKHGIEETQAEAIFAFIEPFAGYGFNRAHACAYGWVAYQTAWLKVHYPAEFMAASLTKEAGNAEKIALLKAECDRMGVRMLPPDVQKSGVGFTLEKQADGKYAVRFGFTAIKGIGVKPAEVLVAEREAYGPYRTLPDLFARCEARSVTSGTVGALAQAGALESLGERGALMEALEEAKKLGKKYRGHSASLFAGAHPVTDYVLPAAKPATIKQRLEWERDLLGVYLTAHPLDEVSSRLEEVAETRTIEIDDSALNQDVKLAGRLSEVTLRKIKASGATMVTGVFEDRFGTVPFVAFPAVYEKNPALWHRDYLVVLRGKVRERDASSENSALQVVVTAAYLYDDTPPVAAPAVASAAYIVSVTMQSAGGAQDVRVLRTVSELLRGNPGDDAYEVWLVKGALRTRTLFSTTSGQGTDYMKIMASLNAIDGLTFDYQPFTAAEKIVEATA